MNRKFGLFSLLIMAFLTFFQILWPFSGVLLAEVKPVYQTGKPGKVVMVVIDRLTWDDFVQADIPVLKQLARTGAIGLMTTNPAGGFGRTPQNTYTTIGAGAKVGGGVLAGAGYNATEDYQNGLAGQAYNRYTGTHPLPSNIVHLGLADMEKVNQGLKYKYCLGAIGTLLHQNGLHTAVIGNADRPGLKNPESRFRRYGVTIAMDNRGLVDYGDISDKVNQKAPQSLGGTKTDYDAVLDRFTRVGDKADFIVIETGDTSRVDEEDFITMPGVLAQARQKALVDADRFVGRLLPKLDLSSDLIMLVVPGPPYEAMDKGEFLTPFIIAGRGIGHDSIVWSSTTKRPGLIANIDIAATVARHFGLPASIGSGNDSGSVSLLGQDIESRVSGKPVEQVSQLYNDVIFLYNSRYPLVKGYINTELVVIILCIAAVVLRKRAARLAHPFLVAFTAVPLVLLWTNYLPHTSITLVGLEVIGLTAVITTMAMIMGLRRRLDPFIVTTGLTMAVIVTDLFVGGPLAKSSPLSYDVISGARFYGLGNEYMGVLIGCTIVFTGLTFDRWQVKSWLPKVIAMLIFLLVTYTIAAPNLGTNVGGTIAAVAGLGAAGLIILGGRVNRKTLGAICTGTVIALVGLIAYDLTRSVEAQSHIGRTAALIRQNGFSEIAGIISRKWEMNFKLITYTSWSWFYGSCLLAITLMDRRLAEESNRFRGEHPWFSKMLPSVGLGSMFALIFNDSGVVAAATMIIYAAAPYLTGLIQETKNNFSDGYKLAKW